MNSLICEVMQGDCLEKMKLIADGSMDAIICDPPYGTMKGAELDGWKNKTTEWDEIINHDEMLEECNRVLRMGGVLVLFSQDPYTGKLMTEQHGNLPFSYRMTWLKDHFANALIAKKAPVSYTEDICVFFKKYDLLGQHPLRDYSKKVLEETGMGLKKLNEFLGHRKAEHFFYINSTQFGLCTEEVYNELINKFQLSDLEWFKSYAELEEINRKFNRKFNLEVGKKFKSNVLSYKKPYENLHPTQKPVELMKDLVRTYTDEGDIVLDFTCGSGSTGVACKQLNRHFIGIERDFKYCKTARDRLKDSQQLLEMKGEPFGHER